jgi:hypothetical protein
LKARWEECTIDERPSHIIVDVIGIGAGIVDRLQELSTDGVLDDTSIVGINVSESPAVKARFRKLRDEMYWKGREWFEGRDVECSDEQIGAELADVLYSYHSGGQIKVESKDDIKERLGTLSRHWRGVPAQPHGRRAGDRSGEPGPIPARTITGGGQRMGRVKLPTPTEIEVIKRFLTESCGMWVEGVRFRTPATGSRWS